MNILNLHRHRKNAGFESIDDYHGDLMIMNSFEGAEQICRIIEGEKTFDRVYLMDKVFNNGRFHRIQTLLDILSPAYFIRKKHHLDSREIKDVYDVITAPKYSILIDQIWRLNRKAKLDLYEDGIGTYHLNILFGPRSGWYKKFRKVLPFNDFRDYRHLYIIDRSLYVGGNEDRVAQVRLRAARCQRQ